MELMKDGAAIPTVKNAFCMVANSLRISLEAALLDLFVVKLRNNLASARGIASKKNFCFTIG